MKLSVNTNNKNKEDKTTLKTERSGKEVTTYPAEHLIKAIRTQKHKIIQEENYRFLNFVLGGNIRTFIAFNIGVYVYNGWMAIPLYISSFSRDEIVISRLWNSEKHIPEPEVKVLVSSSEKTARVVFFLNEECGEKEEPATIKKQSALDLAFCEWIRSLIMDGFFIRQDNFNIIL